MYLLHAFSPFLTTNSVSWITTEASSVWDTGTKPILMTLSLVALIIWLIYRIDVD